MSYEEFRRRIDTARQILVGAVPSPAGQIDQITYALIYKFMNDIDDQSAALGGKRTYFTGDYAKFNWHELMSSQIGAHERLELYREAIQTMAKNENIPELFRSIYQNAFLPFNSANVLSLFLKEMDKFSHGESDDIGDAYEYLLSITGAQGDVGQFRTPRHIIDFIVKAVDPTKDDKVLDPAVGTAGFLISAYKHVRAKHDGKDDQGNHNDEKRLTSAELDKIHKNYRGFDIDPTMVRTAKVNMYLHGFKTPDIINHDSLSSEDYWNEWYDVILANPPFMTPKGGIQPHKRFSIKNKKAEALFVDYIASHLKPNGRAGIVVPDGIVNNSEYKELRHKLLDVGLYASISLHQYVFKPYAGAKTSILLFDRKKKNKNVLFINIDNDGYSKGEVRSPIEGSQLEDAINLIRVFQESNFDNIKRFEAVEDVSYKLQNYSNIYSSLARYTKNYTLFANTFIYDNRVESAGELAKIEELFWVERGTLQSTKATPGEYRFITASDEILSTSNYTHDAEAIIIATGAGGSLGKPHYYRGKFSASDLCLVLTPKDRNLEMLFYYYYFKSIRPQIVRSLAKGVGKQSINIGDFKDFYIRKFSSSQQLEKSAALRQRHENIQELNRQIDLENDLILDMMSS